MNKELSVTIPWSMEHVKSVSTVSGCVGAHPFDKEMTTHSSQFIH